MDSEEIMETEVTEESTMEDDLFYFESDHLALKGNEDYSQLVKTLFILAAQRKRMIKDFETIIQVQEQALRNPLSFIEKVKNREPLGIPDIQVIPEVPTIEWSKYNMETPKGIDSKSSSCRKTENATSTSLTADNQSKIVDTRNVRWTSDEQRKLEELLHKYPPEAIELRRFKKIANDMPNRTVEQVISRVQKYFAKLIKAGEPVPGRMPKYAERYKKSRRHDHQKYNNYLFKPTTFFPAYDVPVVLNESDETPGPSVNGITPTKAGINYLVPTSSSQACEDDEVEEAADEVSKEIQYLERIKSNLLRNTFTATTTTATTSTLTKLPKSYDCLSCKNEIYGVRWHCLTCPAESTNYCNNCMVNLVANRSSHFLSHEFEEISDQRQDMSEPVAATHTKEFSGDFYGEKNDSTSSSDSDDEDFANMSDYCDKLI